MDTPENQILPDYRTTGDIALKKQSTLRKIVGITGILLPFLVYFFLWITDGFHLVLPSISHYYFTRAASLFEIIVSLLAVFLLIYKGEDFIDYILSNAAGISALLMLLLPTNNLKGLMMGKYDAVAVTFFEQSKLRPVLHYVFAAIFLLCLAFMSLFLFTRSNPNIPQQRKEKVQRNRLYRICGIVMLCAILTVFLGFINVIDENFYNEHNLTFWMEVIAVEAFGISWMVKGGLMLADKKIGSQ